MLHDDDVRIYIHINKCTEKENLVKSHIKIDLLRIHKRTTYSKSLEFNVSTHHHLMSTKLPTYIVIFGIFFSFFLCLFLSLFVLLLLCATQCSFSTSLFPSPFALVVRAHIERHMQTYAAIYLNETHLLFLLFYRH